MVLKEAYTIFANCALTIDGFKLGSKKNARPYDITKLANAYVEADRNNDERKKSQYISALMVRYWYMIPVLYEKSKTLRVSMDDMVDWLYDSFMKAFKYCSWLDKNKSVSKKSKGAEMCFNQCITSTRQWWFKHLNQNIRRINATTVSLHTPIDKSYDDTLAIIDTIGKNDTYENLSVSNILINSFISKGELFNAILIDGIINQDTFSTKKKKITYEVVDDEGSVTKESYDKYKDNFSKTKLCSHLKNLDENFINYFSSHYNVSREKVAQEALKLGQSSNINIYRHISKLLTQLKDSKEVLSLCM